MKRSIHDGNDRRFSVTLNGRNLCDVIWADEEQGQAEVYEHESRLEVRGERVRDPGAPIGYRTLLVQGKVRIIEHPVTPPEPQQGDFDSLWMCGYATP